MRPATKLSAEPSPLPCRSDGIKVRCSLSLRSRSARGRLEEAFELGSKSAQQGSSLFLSRNSPPDRASQSRSYNRLRPDRQFGWVPFGTTIAPPSCSLPTVSPPLDNLPDHGTPRRRKFLRRWASLQRTTGLIHHTFWHSSPPSQRCTFRPSGWLSPDNTDPPKLVFVTPLNPGRADFGGRHQSPIPVGGFLEGGPTFHFLVLREAVLKRVLL